MTSQWILRCLLGGLLWGGAALAQQAAGQPFQAAPLYDLGANPYGQLGEPDVNLSGNAPWTHNVHGYVEAGISSYNGKNVAAGVIMPLVPGKLNLAVQATSGQMGGLWDGAGGKPGVLRYDAYQASLDWHPTADSEAMIGIESTNFRWPARR